MTGGGTFSYPPSLNPESVSSVFLSLCSPLSLDFALNFLHIHGSHLHVLFSFLPPAQVSLLPWQQQTSELITYQLLRSVSF